MPLSSEKGRSSVPGILTIRRERFDPGSEVSQQSQIRNESSVTGRRDGGRTRDRRATGSSCWYAIGYVRSRTVDPRLDRKGGAIRNAKLEGLRPPQREDISCDAAVSYHKAMVDRPP